MMAIKIRITTLKSLINKQGGYVVLLVLSEYSFIRDFRLIPGLLSLGGARAGVPWHSQILAD